jgi:hypothetical protein
MRTGGIHTSLEGVGIFGVDNNLRPDITARNFPGSEIPVAFDIRITSAVPANSAEVSNATANDPLAPQKHLQSNYNEKMLKYGDRARANNVGFKPIIIDITGKMHADSRAVLVTCIKEAARIRNIPFSRLWHYWMSSIQITLQRAIISGMDTLRANALEKGLSYGRYVAIDHVMDRGAYIGT